MADEAETGVLAGTHTAPPAAGADLFGAPAAPAPVSLGTRAGRPNRLNRLMAARVEERYGQSVLDAVVAEAMAPLGDLAREAVEAAQALAEARGTSASEELKGVSVGWLLAYRAARRAEALPYLHGKRAPVDAKGEVAPVYLAFQGLSAADLRRPDDEITDAEMTIDLAAIALGPGEENQGLASEPRSADGRNEQEQGE